MNGKNYGTSKSMTSINSNTQRLLARKFLGKFHKDNVTLTIKMSNSNHDDTLMTILLSKYDSIVMTVCACWHWLTGRPGLAQWQPVGLSTIFIAIHATT